MKELMGAPSKSTLRYLEEVEAFFLARRGRGLMISPADAQILRELEEAGVPTAVVCRGIARAFEAHEGRPNDAPPRSVRACLPFVEEEVRRWRAKEVGRNTWDVAREARRARAGLSDLLERIEAEGRVARPEARAYYRRAFRGVREIQAALLRDPGTSAHVAQDLAALESRLLAETLAGLSPAESLALCRRAEARIALRRESASERAWAAALQAAREEALRDALGLIPLTLKETAT
jgi:hypothetical protein